MQDHVRDSEKVWSDKIAQLRRRLDDVGCVFEFVSLIVDDDIGVHEQFHRRALSELYEQIMDSQREWHGKLIQRVPVGDYPEPTMSWNISEAVGEQLSSEQIRGLTRTEANCAEPFSLYADFCRPLFQLKTVCYAEDTQVLFREWINVLGLLEHRDISVFSWVVGPWQQINCVPDGHSLSAAWTDFFCLETKTEHVWCLTIWNSERRTLAALAACSAGGT
ncbi:hypothetical protein [Pseudomonas sp. lyk4-TYG-107]|uniref:hypothetical protein n=1 Tax=Pseudomonas sp. lyk4-TYG-107 TaxID=3040317 RepID=UPI00255589D6|nr:hypothetical protein [Pseudomonas sp. lyk4-TYG-107]